MTDQRYFADGKEFLYPHAGDPSPPKDTKVLLLTRWLVLLDAIEAKLKEKNT
jgi:hypothetical protein